MELKIKLPDHYKLIDIGDWVTIRGKGIKQTQIMDITPLYAILNDNKELELYYHSELALRRKESAYERSKRLSP
ncbi:hypothetical protein LCGC14_0342380 [marine sediment metagenome]|uniref:Uncharacterized protein n=1 Tax=marine sediment metagenome TaxID=412755 RepID=A0A0F9W0N0_9ZZZZ